MNTRKGCESEQSTSGNVPATRSEEPVVAHAVSIRIPTFWPEKISLWFKQLEAQFSIAGISRDYKIWICARKFGTKIRGGSRKRHRKSARRSI